MQIFTIKNEDINGRLDCYYYQPEFVELEKKVKNTISTASRTERFINYLLDTFFYTFISGIILTIIDLDPGSLNPILLYFLLILLSIIYFVPLESIFGRTIAKFITRTKVTTVSGGNPSIGEIFIRTLSRFIPFEAFSFLNGEAVGWHDKISRTRVIDA